MLAVNYGNSIKVAKVERLVQRNSLSWIPVSIGTEISSLS